MHLLIVTVFSVPKCVLVYTYIFYTLLNSSGSPPCSKHLHTCLHTSRWSTTKEVEPNIISPVGIFWPSKLYFSYIFSHRLLFSNTCTLTRTCVPPLSLLLLFPVIQTNKTVSCVDTLVLPFVGTAGRHICPPDFQTWQFLFTQWVWAVIWWCPEVTGFCSSTPAEAGRSFHLNALCQH